MTLTLTIILNVVADVAIIGGLAHVMSRPRHLVPHVSAQEAEIWTLNAHSERSERIAA